MLGLYNNFRTIYPDDNFEKSRLKRTLKWAIEQYFGKVNKNIVYLPTVSL
jgi:hypothetical protein